MYALFFHAHQKLDRIAYGHLQTLLPESGFFPKLSTVLHFEGPNGPDAPKLKNHEHIEQPWHFIDPMDVTDTLLHDLIDGHYEQLVLALRARDEIRAGFEAAWLAHALVDGLTPAHHYPYEKELAELRGEERHTRKGLVGRAYVKGDTVRESVLRSFKLIGPKGLLTTHALFEAGAYAVMAPLRLKRALPSPKDIELVSTHGIVGLFRQLAEEVSDLKLYERYSVGGWTQRLSRDIRQELAPRMVRAILLAWFTAAREAEAADFQAIPGAKR
ncbi:MAG: hypothetical protein QFB87_03275 [Patescibacteria group bacterium]|nr:hypothetical protein [Patescibacteria group bacterium]